MRERPQNGAPICLWRLQPLEQNLNLVVTCLMGAALLWSIGNCSTVKPSSIRIILFNELYFGHCCSLPIIFRLCYGSYNRLYFSG